MKNEEFGLDDGVENSDMNDIRNIFRRTLLDLIYRSIISARLPFGNIFPTSCVYPTGIATYTPYTVSIILPPES